MKSPSSLSACQLPHLFLSALKLLVKVSLRFGILPIGTVCTNEASGDPFETMIMHWLCNGANGDNHTNDDNDTNFDNGVNGENNSNSDRQ